MMMIKKFVLRVMQGLSKRDVLSAMHGANDLVP